MLLGWMLTRKAKNSENEAQSIDNQAQTKVENAKLALENSRDLCNKAITALGKRKIDIFQTNVVLFLEIFNKLHAIEFGEVNSFNENYKLDIDNKLVCDLQEMGKFIISNLKDNVEMFESTIGALGPFSSSKANITLAYFCCKPLIDFSAVSLLLTLPLLEPVLQYGGAYALHKAKINKEKAYSNLAKAEEFEEEVKNMRVVCKGIRMRANMFERLLIKLDALFEPAIYELKRITETTGNDYSKFSLEEKKTVAACLSLVSAIKAVFETPILTEEGTLNQETENVNQTVDAVIKSY